jgi:hypothetical protein
LTRRDSLGELIFKQIEDTKMKIWASMLVVAALSRGMALGQEVVKPTPKATQSQWTNVPDVEARPDDKFEKRPLHGLMNVSREERRHAAAKAVLDKLKQEWSTKTPEELIGLLCTESDEAIHGVKYYVALGGNKLIEAELARRGNAARAALEAHRKDIDGVFDGWNGQGTNIGKMCDRLLDALTRK